MSNAGTMLERDSARGCRGQGGYGKYGSDADPLKRKTREAECFARGFHGEGS